MQHCCFEGGQWLCLPIGVTQQVHFPSSIYGSCKLLPTTVGLLSEVMRWKFKMKVNMLGKVLNQQLVALFKCVSCIASACFCCFNLIFNGWFYPEMLGQCCLATWSETSQLNWPLLLSHSPYVWSETSQSNWPLLLSHSPYVWSETSQSNWPLLLSHSPYVWSETSQSNWPLLLSHSPYVWSETSQSNWPLLLSHSPYVWSETSQLNWPYCLVSAHMCEVKPVSWTGLTA